MFPEGGGMNEGRLPFFYSHGSLTSLSYTPKEYAAATAPYGRDTARETQACQK